MNARIAIATALVLCVVLTASSISTLRQAKNRIRSESAPLRPVQSRIERFAAIAREVNAYLLVLAVGLAALDFAVMVALNVPDPAVLDSSSPGQDRVVAVADPKIPAATETRSP